MKRFILLVAAVTAVALSGCSKQENKEPRQAPQLDELPNVELESQAQYYTYNIPQLAGYDITVTTDIDSPPQWIWVEDSDTGKFKVEVRSNFDDTKGYRTARISLSSNDKEIGSFNIYQTREPLSIVSMTWGTVGTTLSLPEDGLEATKYMYNLEKTSGGKDSYKNYPAFAYCIDMNVDPENNMKWYLPSYSDDAYKTASESNYPKNFWTSSLNGSGDGVPILKWASNGYQHVGYAALRNERYYVFAVKK